MKTKIFNVLLLCVCSLLLSACGGGSLNASVGGAVSGLGSGLSLTLQNNGGDNLTLTSNQSFTFATSISPNSTYNVTVLNQPTGQTCAVTNGSGSIDAMGDNIGNVSVSCNVTSSVGGTVSGLLPGTSVTLSNNGLLLQIDTNGSFAFPGLLLAGTPYNVSISIQPAGETCQVSNALGVVVDNVTAQVLVACH